MKKPFDHRVIIGVMGGGTTKQSNEQMAYELGKHIAEQGWILLNGGRNCGVMDASAKGAKQNGGMTIGILPDSHIEQMSQWIDIPILTDMGMARNAINVLSSHVVVACSGGAGTLSEIALALKCNKTVIAMGWNPGTSFDIFADMGQLYMSSTPEETILKIQMILGLTS
jgi:hypothetical protein